MRMRLLLPLLLPLFSLRAEPSLPEVTAPEVAGPFVPDGRGDEPFWETLPEYHSFHILGGRSAEGLGTTRFRVATHQGKLLVLVTSEQAKATIHVECREPFSSDICRDDSVELFITAGESGPIHQFALNAEGYPFSQQLALDRHAPRPRHLPGVVWEGGAHAGSKAWSAEFAIPLAGLPRSEGAWRINVGRTWGALRLFQSWAPVTRGFAHWERHALLRPSLPPGPVIVPKITRSDWKTGAQVLVAEWSGLPEGDYRVSTSLSQWQRGPLPVREPVLSGLKPVAGRLQADIPLELSYQRHPQELIVELLRGDESMALLHERVRLPRLLTLRMERPVFYPAESVRIPMALDLAPGTPIGGQLRVQVTPTPGGAPWRQEMKIGGETTVVLPSDILRAGLSYQVEVEVELDRYGSDRATSRFYSVQPLFSEP